MKKFVFFYNKAKVVKIKVNLIFMFRQLTFKIPMRKKKESIKYAMKMSMTIPLIAIF